MRVADFKFSEFGQSNKRTWFWRLKYLEGEVAEDWEKRAKMFYPILLGVHLTPQTLLSRYIVSPKM